MRTFVGRYRLRWAAAGHVRCTLARLSFGSGVHRRVGSDFRPGPFPSLFGNDDALRPERRHGLFQLLDTAGFTDGYRVPLRFQNSSWLGYARVARISHSNECRR